jgi:hypothetical protein
MTDPDRAPGCDAVIVELADRLWEAGASRVAIDPISETWPDLTVDDAYAIQTRNFERRQAAGRVLPGRKVGLTSRPMQEFLRVFEPLRAGVKCSWGRAQLSMGQGPLHVGQRHGMKSVLRGVRPGRSSRRDDPCPLDVRNDVTDRHEA